jgi:choice-of-anchor B domain-containing protein
MMRRGLLASLVVVLAVRSASAAVVPCESGRAGAYLCQDVDLVAHLDLPALRGIGGAGGEGWGWTDASTGREYAIVGHSRGTAFVDVSDPDAVTYLGILPTPGGTELPNPRLRVSRNHLYVVRPGLSGVQVFDLAGLPNVTAPPQVFTETAFISGVGPTHGIAINEETRFAYLVGGGCDLQMLSLADPARPASVGCFNEAPGPSPALDAHCVVYRGPDLAYRGREICVAPRGESASIVDVQEKTRPRAVARLQYPDSGSVAQGWLTEDHRYYLQADTSDERLYDHDTRTYLWDLTDLDAPRLVARHAARTRAADSALVVKGNELHQANSQAGYRMLSLSRVALGQLDETAFFDMHPANDANDRPGAFNSYPFYASGRVAVSDTELGLFVLEPTGCRSPATPALRSPADRAASVVSSPTLDWADAAGSSAYDLELATDPKFENVVRKQNGLTSSAWLVNAALNGAASYWWRVRAATSCGSGAWSAGSTFTTANRPAPSPAPGPRIRNVQAGRRTLVTRDPSTMPRRPVVTRRAP